MTNRVLAVGTLSLGCLALLLSGRLRAADPPPAADPQAVQAEPSKFVRLERDASSRPLALQTAITRFQGTAADQAGLTVDLIGAVHIGDKSYYKRLNDAFTKYDVVLYELVAPSGTRVPKGGSNRKGAVNSVQNSMRDMLGLEHQLEQVDYTPANLVHADMSPDQLAKSMKDRGESLWKMLFRAIGHSMAKQSEGAKSSSSDWDIMKALLDRKQHGALKLVLAEQFEDLDNLTAALEGPEGSTLLSERNKVALAELGRQIKAGKRRIAIFYGCAHLPDMERHLIADFGLKPAGQQWLTAWNLKEKSEE